MLQENLQEVRYLDPVSQEQIKKIPALEENPPIPHGLIDLSPLQLSFWTKLHPHLPSPYFLAKNPVNILIQYDKEQLHTLCRFLGMFDLYEELQKNIHAKLFKAIKEALSAEELKFLQSIDEKDNPVKLPKMHLGAWDKNKESLDKAIFDRGRMRLRGAVSSCFNTFFQFIPAEFGPLEKKPSKEISELLWKQVQTVLKKAMNHVKHI